MTGTGCIFDGRGFVPADFDRDGDLDFLVVNDGQPLQYFENRTADLGNWLGVQLRGDGANPYGIGARVTIEAGGKRQVREIHNGSGYLSSPPPEAHFGLGKNEQIDRLEVRWPDGRVEKIGPQPGNQYLVVTKGQGCHKLALPVTTGGAPR